MNFPIPPLGTIPFKDLAEILPGDGRRLCGFGVTVTLMSAAYTNGTAWVP